MYWVCLKHRDSSHEKFLADYSARPPGGAYVPASIVSPAYPTIFTTTAKPAVATAPGSIPNCGLWYNVTAGSECNLVAIKFSLTLSQFINMNPSLDSVCSNLLLGILHFPVFSFLLACEGMLLNMC
jgi:hypothetical protein